MWKQQHTQAGYFQSIFSKYSGLIFLQETEIFELHRQLNILCGYPLTIKTRMGGRKSNENDQREKHN